MMKRFSCAGAFDASTKVVRLREAATGTKRSFASLNGNLMRRQES